MCRCNPFSPKDKPESYVAWRDQVPVTRECGAADSDHNNGSSVQPLGTLVVNS